MAAHTNSNDPFASGDYTQIMTPSDPTPLHRLLDRRETRALLTQFESLMPGVELGVIDTEGKLFVGTRNDEFSTFPLNAGLGSLTAHGPADANILNALNHALSMVITQALAKREIAQETLERYREINLLYEIGESIGSCLDADIIPGLVLEAASGVIRSTASIVLLPSASGDFEIKASSGAAEDVENLYNATCDLVTTIFERGRPDIVESAAFGTILCTPLKVQERVLGVVVVGGQTTFTASDEKLLMALSGQAAIAIEKAWLHQQEIQRQRLEEELAVGRQIQRSLLPQNTPQIPSWEFAAIYEAARQVGGDLYDFFELPDDRLGLLIADVTGKGVPAALFMAFSRTIIRNEAMAGGTPAHVLQCANDLIVRDSRANLFLTAFYAILNTETGELIYADGVHDWPLWIHEGQCQELATQSSLLGMFPTITLEERSIYFAPGDALVMFTDGVTEARSASGEFFGDDRLQTIVRAHADASAEGIASAIANAVDEFTGNSPQSDDVTLVVVKRKSS